jgi:hypothetical protein
MEECGNLPFGPNALDRWFMSVFAIHGSRAFGGLGGFFVVLVRKEWLSRMRGSTLMGQMNAPLCLIHADVDVVA